MGDIKAGDEPGRDFDPYIDWRLDVLNEFRDMALEKDAWWMTHIQLADMSIEDLEKANNDSEQVLFIPPIYADRTAKPPRQVIIGYGKRDFFKKAQGQPTSTKGEEPEITRFTIGPYVHRFVPGDVSTDLPYPVKTVLDGTVIMAVIDDGIAFAHERFRTADGLTRVEYAWIMEPTVPNPSSTVSQGRELTKDDIDALLQDPAYQYGIDEERLYRRAGLSDHGTTYRKTAARRIGHGTHVMDLACGYEPGTMDDKRPIICVQLPAAVTEDTSLPSLEEPLQLALDYVLKRAGLFVVDGTGVRPPLVINFSYGAFAGPHDGTHPAEILIDDRLRTHKALKHRVRAVLPSGNGNLSRCHAVINFDAHGEDRALKWRVQPDDRTESKMEIWLPHGAPANRLQITLETPGGALFGPVSATNNLVQVLLHGNEVGRIAYDYDPYPTERGRFRIMLRATAHEEKTLKQLAPSGLWKVHLHNLSLDPPDTVHAWIQRDDAAFGYPVRGRQSYFDDPDFERFDSMGRLLDTDPAGSTSYVKRSGTINSIATGYHPVIAAGYRREEADPSDYSAAGPVLQLRNLPTDDPPHCRSAPTAMALSEDSGIRHGLIAAGTRSGSRVALNGTSVATPLVARLVADRLAAGQKGNRDDVWNLAVADEAPKPAPHPPPARGGGGRLKLKPFERVKR